MSRGDDADGFLTVSEVRKHYATVRAVDGISFSHQRGEVLALLGPNGAGKTTLLRMLAGITRPDSGTIEWVGGSLDAADLGYLPEDRGLYRDVPIQRTLAYFARLHGVAPTDANRTADEWLQRLGLADRATENLGTLSKGNQQKVQFASAVLHRPRYAILDEPFSGLDPINQDVFIGYVRDLRADGTTVLLSAHQMQLVERLADRAIVMNRGRILLEGALSDLIAGGSLHDLYVKRVREAEAMVAEATP